MLHSTNSPERSPLLLGGVHRGSTTTKKAATTTTTQRRRPTQLPDDWDFDDGETDVNTEAMFSHIRPDDDDDDDDDDNEDNDDGYNNTKKNGKKGKDWDGRNKYRRSWTRRILSVLNSHVLPKRIMTTMMNRNNINNRGSSSCCCCCLGVNNKNDNDDLDDTLCDTYEDDFNDQPWQCSFGTTEDDGIWMNRTDRAGTIMAALVWVLILYSAITMMVLCQRQHVRPAWTGLYTTLATLALACHAKTTFTDPGAVPSTAVPVHTKGVKFHTMCSICQTYKPKMAHHCRVCNRCITGMDHHCPWMNNCIGVANLKHFALFLFYTWMSCAMALLIFLVNYFFCNSERCEFSSLEIQLVRAMSCICTAAWIFTSNMLMSVTYAILTGIGTIDRLKKQALGIWHLADEQPIPWEHVVGIGPMWTWFLPIDPLFPDYDVVMGFSTTQRLLREQARQRKKQQQHQQHSPHKQPPPPPTTPRRGKP